MIRCANCFEPMFMVDGIPIHTATKRPDCVFRDRVHQLECRDRVEQFRRDEAERERQREQATVFPRYPR